MTDHAIAHLGLLEDEEIALDLAALDLSALDHDGIDLGPYHALLDEMEAALGEADIDGDDGDEQADALARVIGEDYGFAGDVEGYDAPVNADMIRVLDRRRGLPVSLAILYVALARRLGWAAHALDTPGHVVVSVGEDEHITIIDPFAGGGPVPAERLLALGARPGDGGDREEPDQVEFVAMSNRATLVRLLVNQASRAEAAGDAARAIAMYRRITAVAPEDGGGWWRLARLQIRARDKDGARASLSAMLEVTRDAGRRREILSALEAIA